MRIVVPSIGRCGSTLVHEILCEARGQERPTFAGDWYATLPHYPDDVVLKTHSHFRGEPSFDYRAVFLWGHVGDIIHSLYLGRANLRSHLENLEMLPRPYIRFFELLDSNKDEAFLYLIGGDKLRLKENMASWRRSNRCLFVKYEDLCQYPEREVQKIREHTGLNVNTPAIRAREANWERLPAKLRAAIRSEYAGELL